MSGVIVVGGFGVILFWLYRMNTFLQWRQCCTGYSRCREGLCVVFGHFVIVYYCTLLISCNWHMCRAVCGV